MPRPRFSLRTLLVVVTVCALASPTIPLVIAKYKEWQNRKQPPPPAPPPVDAKIAVEDIEDQTTSNEGITPQLPVRKH
jgi:hypothetical protein